MCQLLGMNCNTPTDICFSFEGFRTRGGLTDEHTDGWGIAFFEGVGCRVFLDVQPSVHSPVAELVRSYPIRSMNVIAHIRKSTQGVVSLENTHPFQRELWGNYWVFAHNGNLSDYAPVLDGSFLPVGETDSERAFCFILQTLRSRFATRPAQEQLLQVMQELSKSISTYGVFNFLLSNGEFLLAHCSSDLTYISRKAPFSVAHLKDQDISVDFSEVTSPDDRVAIIATQPLTDNEVWLPLAPSSLNLFVNGTLISSVPTV